MRGSPLPSSTGKPAPENGTMPMVAPNGPLTTLVRALARQAAREAFSAATKTRACEDAARSLLPHAVR